MKRNILFLIVAVSFALLGILHGAPTPAPAPKPTPIKGGGKKATAGAFKTPEKKTPPIPTPKQNVYKKTYGPKDVSQLATPPPTPKQNVYKKHQTYAPKDVSQAATATPNPKKGVYKKDQTYHGLKDVFQAATATPNPKKGVYKKDQTYGPKDVFQLATATPIPAEERPPPTGELEKVPYPGFHGKKIAPAAAPPELGKGGKGKGKANAQVWININVYPPTPSEFGPPITVPTIPVYRAVPSSKVNFVPGGVAPVPEDYSPPPQNAPVETSPTALRGWNGQEEPPGRAFDQTLVKLAAASDGTASWQFFWKTTGPEAQAARWEVATVPFVDDSIEFPPAGLVGYGDASINADSPLTENFFAVDFSGFAKNFEEGSVPNKYYMRVVPVDPEGNPIGKPSNFVRVDLP
jgi:hypothetical protein